MTAGMMRVKFKTVASRSLRSKCAMWMVLVSYQDSQASEEGMEINH